MAVCANSVQATNLSVKEERMTHDCRKVVYVAGAKSWIRRVRNKNLSSTAELTFVDGFA